MIWVVLFLIVLTLDTCLLWIVIQERRSLQADNAGMTMLESIFAAILAMTIVTSWLGLILAEVDMFSLMALTILLAALALGLGAWLKWRHIPLWSPPGLRLDRYDAIALILAALIGVLYARPAEYIIGGQDPGTYMNIGINIARTGGILIYDQRLADVGSEVGDLLLYQTWANRGYEGIRFAGFYLRSFDGGVVTPQFFHVFPVWIAILYEIGGTHLALFATPLFGWLAVIALYMLGRRLIHPGAGLLAMALLAVNISQLWFARNPFADIVLQCYLTSGFWALALFVDRAGQHHPATVQAALLSGACFGLSHLIKLDAFVTPFVVLGFIAYCWITGIARRPHAYFFGVYLLMAGHAALHAYLFPLPYVLDTFGMFRRYLRFGLAGLAAAIPLLILINWKRKQIARFLSRPAKYQVWLGRIFIVAILILSLYAYFVRPLRADLGMLSEDELSTQGKVYSWLHSLAQKPQTRISNGKVVRTFIEEGIVRLGWYLTPLGIWLGIAGFLYWATTQLKLRSAPFLAGALLGSILIFQRGAIVSCFFWAFKRYIPIVIPAFILFIAYLVWKLWPADRSHWPRTILPITIASFLIISYVTGSLMFWEHIEYEGAIEDIAVMAESLPENAVLLFHQSTAGTRISLPMHYIHGRESYILTQTDANNARLRETITQWHAQGRPVYWVTHTCKPTIKYYGSLTQVSEFDVLWPETPCLLDKLPDYIEDFTPTMCFYKIESTEYNIPHDLNANFDDKIVLMGYKLKDDEDTPGELELTLYWRAQQRLDTDYTVFTHVIDEQQTIWGQKDSQPVNATRPTSQWKNGQIVIDRITIPIQADVPSGTYRLQVGLYNLATMERLPILNSDGEITGDHVVLETIQVTAQTTDEATTPSED